MHRRTSRIAAVTAAILALGLTSVIYLPNQSAFGQTGGADIPSVSVRPAGTSPADPNGGQWFVAEAAPGSSVTLVARITNVARVPQRVRLFLADLIFTEAGPSLRDGNAIDIGAWGGFARPEEVIAAGATVEVPFTITVPAGAEPGDHIGAVVVESQPQERGQIHVVKQVATRFYVTVPGEASRALEIMRLDSDFDSALTPRQLSVTATVRNAGNIKLQPSVRIGGVSADGSSKLLARSIEGYSAVKPVPWYGGPIDLEVVARSEAGVRRRPDSVFVIPWVPLLLVINLMPLAAAGRRRMRALRRLRSELSELRARVGDG